MRQELIYDLYNNGILNQHDIYKELQSISNINILAVRRIILSKKDILNKYLLNYIKIHYKESWNYKDFEDCIQSLYQTFHEFMIEKLDSYGITPNGYKRAIKEWSKEYKRLQ